MRPDVWFSVYLLRNPDSKYPIVKCFQMNINYTLNFNKIKNIHVHTFVVWQLSIYRGKILKTKALVFCLEESKGHKCNNKASTYPRKANVYHYGHLIAAQNFWFRDKSSELYFTR